MQTGSRPEQPGPQRRRQQRRGQQAVDGTGDPLGPRIFGRHVDQAACVLVQAVVLDGFSQTFERLHLQAEGLEGICHPIAPRGRGSRDLQRLQLVNEGAQPGEKIGDRLSEPVPPPRAALGGGQPTHVVGCPENQHVLRADRLQVPAGPRVLGKLVGLLLLEAGQETTLGVGQAARRSRRDRRRVATAGRPPGF